MTSSLTESSQDNSGGMISKTLDFLTRRNNDQRNQQIAAFVKGEFEKCKKQRFEVERQWYLNLAFFNGRQWVQWIKTAASTTGFRLFVPPAPPWRVRFTINKCRPIIRKEIAKLTSQKPNWTVVPNTTEDQDIVAAQVAEQIFASAYEEKNLQVLLKRTVWWSSVCGTGYIKCYWDPSAECGYGQYKYTGDIEMEPIDPFHIYVPDLTQEDIEKQAYVIHAQTRPVEWVNARFKGFNIQPDAKASTEIMEEAYLNLTGSKNQFPEQALLLEMWIKPNMHPRFPDGAVILVCNGQVLYISEIQEMQLVPGPDGQPVPIQGPSVIKYPYEHNKYPFAKVDHILSGRYYATSVLDDIVSIQREYNRTRSQIVENKNMMGRPQFLAPKGSMQADKITAEPGQVIPYLPGLGQPLPLQPPGLPSYISDHIDRMDNDFDDLSAQHEVSRGQAPGSVVAATAISTLQEADDSQLSTTIDSLEAAIKKIGNLYLCYVTQFWDGARLVKTTGEDQAFDAQFFQASQMAGNTDVRVEAGSALATSKSAKRAFIMDLMTNGIIPPDQGLRMLEIAGVEKMFEEAAVDHRQAGRENLRMQMGEDIPPNTWDAHDLHIQVHNKFRKTQQFEMLDPMRKMLFEKHVTLHQMAMMLSAEQMAVMPIAGDPNALPPGQQQGQPALPGM